MKKAVVIMNLGTPAEPTKNAVRSFLKEFLSDSRVVEIPRAIWWWILHLIILNFRTPRVARAYQKIWQQDGSPLRVITVAQADKLQTHLQTTYGKADCPQVKLAMTYSGPCLADVVSELQQQGVDHIVLLPLYPQYSATTTGSIYDQLAAIIVRQRDIPSVHIIKQYFDHPLYIKALAHSVEEQWSQTGRPDRLLMSFHSIPQRYVDAGDPYYEQCMGTAKLLAEKLGLNQGQWLVSFQSRIGFAKWLSPYTIEVLKELGEQEIKHVDVICPAFAADCLETLEEIQYENKAVFIAAGGEQFNLIPCLNEHPDHIEMMASIIDNYLPKTS
ncbi:ferrochelatase [Oceanicoccus sp. KOV_DT_Chl]|uniref:ferrochelatase n=1 Tax=Oceanicoccus sp. KOV_DT_Chl TaxID=1904639 RepID=UPI000C7CC362|nr:ferrochelatase [Oceanicoccus sp. KOV_DT_Chl]